MRPSTALVDAGIAVVVVIVTLIVAPGLAVVGVLAVAVLLVGGASVALERRRGRSWRRR